MKLPFDARLINLASKLSKPLYAVGGCVRNFLINGTLSGDVDLAGDIDLDQLTTAINEVGFKVLAEYNRTGTLVFGDDYQKRYEFTTLRKEEYLQGGGHTPYLVERTHSLLEDALRRDFKCNAVYYDLKTGSIVDVLGGVDDIKNRRLDTVTTPKEVFSHDGLRLMRLARFCAELNFKPTPQVLEGARLYADNIKDISVERIYAELTQMLCSDTKYPFSDQKGHYTALKILDDTRVLDRIIPELTLGRGMKQRSDFHDHDVLEHSLRCVLYAPSQIRLAALLHDVAKPFCMIRDGRYHFHAVEGENLARQVLKRLKAPERVIGLVTRLVKNHMLDMKLDVREIKIRRFIVENADLYDELLMVKQADYSACKDDLAECPTVTRWKQVYKSMLESKTPFSVKQLKISAEDLIQAGYKGEQIGKQLSKLLELCVENPQANDRDRLLAIIGKK